MYWDPKTNHFARNAFGMTRPHDLTLPPDMTHKTGTGAVRSHHPEYRSYLPPCNHACPAGENIQAWLSLAQAGRFREAWDKLIEENPLPAVHGRACYHPCQNACNRDQVDSGVNIHAVERFLGDLALEQGWSPRLNAAATGKRILIVGAGPSGLSCAWHLRRLGHEVEIRDAGPVAGGMMHFGIPAFRLPRDVLDTEIQRILDTGIVLKTNHKVDDVLGEKQAGNFDAVFMAIGAHLAHRIDIPAKDSSKIYDAVSYLSATESGEAPLIGRRVAIYGGGNAAMDAARTAKRLGATDAMIIYHRDASQMPAHEIERQEALEEGVQINWLRSIKRFDDQALQVERMQIDEAGQLIPSGEFETLEADSLILALGQKVDTSVLQDIKGLDMNDDGVVSVNPNMMTSIDGIFAGGDMVPSERTITTATGHGKKAARCIHAWLNGLDYQKTESGPLDECPDIHLWYNTDAQSSAEPERSPDERAQDRSKIAATLTREHAI